MVAVPILGGSLMRIPLGLLSDRFGGTRVGIAMLLALFLPLLAGWRCGTTLRVLSPSARCSAWRARRSRSRCRWRAAGIRRSARGWRWASPRPATAAPSWRTCSRRASPRSVGWHDVLALATIPLTLVLVVFAALGEGQPRDAARGSRCRSYLHRAAASASSGGSACSTA